MLKKGVFSLSSGPTNRQTTVVVYTLQAATWWSKRSRHVLAQLNRTIILKTKYNKNVNISWVGWLEQELSFMRVKRGTKPANICHSENEKMTAPPVIMAVVKGSSLNKAPELQCLIWSNKNMPQRRGLGTFRRAAFTFRQVYTHLICVAVCAELS